ncbi:hypothetical protein GWI33_001430 [Rhynchophorus ferrugineus]|uniref:Elongator complex protein 1 n=1 Tax=Rhynchophorus ferrugineus TaxID=354439 RepID=A0A834IVX6_RHYFE|nr:hypothetical protein GWI33_001430 [Rhynchophorus ferrugineus]
MENIELCLNYVEHKDKNIFKNNLKACLGDHVFCFITAKHQLCVAEGLQDLNVIDIAHLIKDAVIDLKYLNFWHYVFIATESTIIIVDPKLGKGVALDSPTDKIKSISWNPNETCLLIVNEEETIYGLHFQVINAEQQQYNFVPLKPVHISDSVPNSVYVGWGSHNTQFKGSKKTVEKITEYLQENSAPIISWRGNGEQFVLNFWRDGRRYLKVFNSNLSPLYQSEVYTNLLPPASFKGHGNFIACAAEHNEKYKIVIFEKNCLVKSEFVVKHIKGKIQSLQYHPDLPILAIYSEDIDNSGSLSIYLYSNGHWYLKQQLKYSKANQLLSYYWINSYDKNMCTLNILTAKGIEQYFLKLVFNGSLQTGVVVIIDGSIAQFTLLSKEVIPPPMSSFNLEFNEVVNKVLYDQKLNLYIFVLADQSLKKYTLENNELEECSQDIISETLNNYSSGEKSLIISSSEVIIDQKMYKFYLDQNRNLLLGNNILCHKVLSMIVFDKYLLFTHAASKLYCIRLSSRNLNMSNWDLNYFYSREVEQGSKIVSLTSKSEIVLILPRGNLETITCRLIGIDIIEQLLKEGKWNDAVKEIRRQRLNWNLLIDLDPERFCKHIDEFIEAASTVSILNQIISEFSVENCLTTLYSQCLENNCSRSEMNKKEVFSKILNKVVSLNPILNLVSIVMLQLRHFTLKAALHSVCQAFQLGNIDICKSAINQILLHHHCSEIINEAYTLYNIEFMNFVYNSCSEDPRIFEPELEKIKDLEPLELRFKMCELGNNFASATKYLIRCSKYDKDFISNFITKHITQHVAYESISPKHINFKLISELFATFLSLRSRHNEAGLVLERAGLLQEAVTHFQRALNWQRVLSLFEKLKSPHDFRKTVLLSIAENLKQQNRLEEAVVLYEHYCDEKQKAIELLTFDHKFQQALHMARKYSYNDLEENLVIPAIIQYRADLLDKITENETKFIEYSSRHLEGETTTTNDDLYSEYGSIISRDTSLRSSSSGGSSASLKARRKQEKKKTDLREGGIYEDIALIRQLYILSLDVLNSGQDVKEVCSTLTDDQSFNECKVLHERLLNVQEKVKTHIPKIWNETFLNASESSEPGILGIIQNRSELDLEFRKPPPTELADDWKMLIFSHI